MTNQFSNLRERCGLTIRGIAELTGRSLSTAYRWERGDAMPDKLVLERLESIARGRAADLAPRPGFRFIDLFAGIGGMRMAFESAGGTCVATCEWDRHARQTYAANFHPSPEEPFYADIRTVTADLSSIRDIPDHDVLVAGFPCQPFSIAGVSKKNALGTAHGFACETQGTLFFELAKIIREKRPRAFLLENVKNLVSHDRGNTFRVIMDVLRNQLGYEFVEHRVVDAKPYVPQHRERTLIVGFREEHGFSWADVDVPTGGVRPTMSSILHNTSEDPDGRYTVGPKFRVAPKYTLTPHLWAYLQAYAAKHKAAGNGFGFGLVGPDSVARTLSARYYKDGSEILVDQGKRRPPRRLTPRECARLMGFDRPGRDSFRIEVSDTQAYRQFGNSVVVPVIESVAKAMAERLADPKPVRIDQMELFRRPRRLARG